MSSPALIALEVPIGVVATARYIRASSFENVHDQRKLSSVVRCCGVVGVGLSLAC
jgi:hypothetical protein